MERRRSSPRVADQRLETFLAWSLCGALSSSLRALEEAGVIKSYAALLNPQAVDLGLTAWIKVRPDLQMAKRFELLEENITRRTEVLECYLLTGEADYRLRVVVPNVSAYEQSLSD